MGSSGNQEQQLIILYVLNILFYILSVYDIIFVYTTHIYSIYLVFVIIMKITIQPEYIPSTQLSFLFLVYGQHSWIVKYIKKGEKVCDGYG